jgi:hypothetical protein
MQHTTYLSLHFVDCIFDLFVVRVLDNCKVKMLINIFNGLPHKTAKAHIRKKEVVRIIPYMSQKFEQNINQGYIVCQFCL